MEPQNEILKLADNYRIETEYPYNIFKVKPNGKRGKYLRESERNPGTYPRIVLNGKDYNKHMVVAEQFIPKPDTDLPLEVDHINNDKKDYHIENLRWVTHKVNCINKKGYRKIDYEYFDTLPEGAKAFNVFKQSHFIDYYYDNNADMYHFNGLRYRKLHVLSNSKSPDHYDVRDINGKIKRITVAALDAYANKGSVKPVKPVSSASPQPELPQITD